MVKTNISHLVTETRNPKTMNLDDMSLKEFLTVMNDEDATVPLTVKKALPEIEKAVEKMIASLNAGGKIYYLGSGTSGRLGILDAAECPPTFSTTDEINGIIAGGPSAILKAKEGAEDDEAAGYKEIGELGLNPQDILVGIAASGRTPHTIGAIKKANELGVYTIGVVCNPDSEIGKVAALTIEVVTGPEVITGSTRLKAGTAQKLVLNMLSTATMVGIGKTYQNLMVDMKPSNKKLVERSKGIVMEATGCSYEEAEKALKECEGTSKVAIVMILLDCDANEAKLRLNKHKGLIKKAIKDQ